MQHKVKGITLIGFVIVLVVAGFFAYTAMRLIPAYTEYFGVVKAMDQESKEPGAAQKSSTSCAAAWDSSSARSMSTTRTCRHRPS